MLDLLTELVKNQPPLLFGLLLAYILIHGTVTFMNFKYMRKNMATRTDLLLAILQQEKQFDERYVLRRDLQLYVRSYLKSEDNGKAKGATH